MPRPRRFEGDEKERARLRQRASRAKKAEEQAKDKEKCLSLEEAVIQMRRAWVRLPAELRPDDIEVAADPLETVRLVTALLDRIVEGRLFDKPTEEIRYAEPGPAPSQQVTKRRRKSA